MTTNLSCRDVERLIVEREERELPADMRGLVAGHLRGCGRCRDFAADRRLIRETFAAARWPAPPETLVRRTRRTAYASAPAVRAPAALPAWLIVALAVATLVIGFWLAVSLADVTPDMALADWPVAGVAAVIVIIQNALMLLLSPVVLRTARRRRSASGSA